MVFDYIFNIQTSPLEVSIPSPNTLALFAESDYERTWINYKEVIECVIKDLCLVYYAEKERNFPELEEKEEIDAVAHIQCSALTEENVDLVFETAIKQFFADDVVNGKFNERGIDRIRNCAVKYLLFVFDNNVNKVLYSDLLTFLMWIFSV